MMLGKEVARWMATSGRFTPAGVKTQKTFVLYYKESASI
jgi:hypothetical protein